MRETGFVEYFICKYMNKYIIKQCIYKGTFVDI